MDFFETELHDFLAEAHPTDIEEVVVKPAIQQIIDDCKDFMENIADKQEDAEEYVDTFYMLRMYRVIKRLIEKRDTIQEG